MSGAAPMRRIIAPTSAVAARMTAMRPTKARKPSVRIAGAGRRRTGVSSAPRLRIKRSCDSDAIPSTFSDQARTQRLERAMQVDLERTGRASGRGRGFRQAALVQRKLLHGLALTLRQRGDGLAERGGPALDVGPFGGVRRRIGMMLERGCRVDLGGAAAKLAAQDV